MADIDSYYDVMHFEQELLGLQDLMIHPLQSSYTSTGIDEEMDGLMISSCMKSLSAKWRTDDGGELPDALRGLQQGKERHIDQLLR